MHYSASDIANILGPAAQMPLPQAELNYIAFDTRRIRNAAQSLFFALNGKNRNGTAFIADAYQKGIRNFVVPHGTQIDRSDCNVYEVENTTKALQKLAAIHRNDFTGPVAGITGSNGKTVVKEWLFQLLQHDFSVARSPRSYNSAIGVAISVLGIEKWHNMALIEAGISEPGEMEVLETMIRPVIGIFTHLGSAHDGNFANRSQKAAEKIQLFRDCDVVVYPKDSVEIDGEIQRLKAQNPLLKTHSWGRHEKANFCILRHVSENAGTRIYFMHRGTEHNFYIPFADQASIENAMTCVCTLAAFERWDEDHLKAFEFLEPLENRMVFMEGKNGNYIVNDSYSNDTDSLEVALDFMLRQQPDKPHVVVLSDLEQAATDQNALYANVADLLREKGTTQLVGVGPKISAAKEHFKDLHTQFFDNTEALLESGAASQFQNHAILVKGARKYKLERLTEQLKAQLHKTVLEIDLNALRHNFGFLRSKTKPGTKMMAMVKAFGYGSGSFEAARTLQFEGVDYLAVAYADEGVELRKSGIQVPIMVMNTSIDDLQSLLQFQLEPVVFNVQGLQAFCAQSHPINIHMEFDTGMHRLGFTAETKGIFKNLPHQVTIKSVFSHLAASEDSDHDSFTHQQIAAFKMACRTVENECGYTFIKHIVNTGGILRFPDAHFDMVRLGIGLYGVDPSGLPNAELENVVSLKTTISQIKSIAAGESVGYGRRGVAETERQIAILPIGYADGLWRALGNGTGHALINGKQSNYVGSICMDMAMCDVTDLPCKEGDEVEIFGKHLPVATLAQWCHTIPYEILTSVSSRVRREYAGEN